MSRWGFIVSAVKNRLSGTKAMYAAHIQHMDVIRGKELYKEIAEYLSIKPTLAEGLVTGIGGFIEDKLRQGYKMDFGVFKVGLTIRGGFDAVNDVFKQKRNSVCVSLSPGVQLKKAVAALRPENLTSAANPVIDTVCGVKEGSICSVIICHENCGVNGSFPPVDFRGEGDGVWLETLEGVRITDAKILSKGPTRIDFVFETAVPSGDYRFVVGFHEGDKEAVVTDSIPVKVVSN